MCDWNLFLSVVCGDGRLALWPRLCMCVKYNFKFYLFIFINLINLCIYIFK